MKGSLLVWVVEVAVPLGSKRQSRRYRRIAVAAARVTAAPRATAKGTVGRVASPVLASIVAEASDVVCASDVVSVVPGSGVGVGMGGFGVSVASPG